MGSRKGLTRLDRTNGFDDGLDYMRVKKSKLAHQNDEIREELRRRNSSLKTDIFKGISINVNGRTQPSADELKRIVLLNGGEYHPYYRYQTTKFMIATNLSSARIKQLRPHDRVIKPQWITESVEAKCLLPYEDYQLFNDDLDNEQLAIVESGSSSTRIIPAKKMFKRTYTNPRTKQVQATGNNHDIREMMSKTVLSIGRSKESETNGLSTAMEPYKPNYSSSKISKPKTSTRKNHDIREYMFKV